MNIEKNKAIISLSLLVPAPSIGAYCAMVLFPNTFLGAGIFMFSKIWLFSLPVIWHRYVDAERLSLSPARKGGFGVGLVTGVILSGIITAGYMALGSSLVDPVFLIRKMEDIGLASRPVYAGCAIYWIAVNSVLEEYVWRWFVVKQCESLFRPAVSIFLSALFFTLHHIVALQVYLSPIAVAICSVGVFIGGATWSFMYMRYRSVWPCYLSHAIVDLAVFVIGAAIIFR